MFDDGVSQIMHYFLVTNTFLRVKPKNCDTPRDLNTPKVMIRLEI